jgi:hypothetical protein
MARVARPVSAAPAAAAERFFSNAFLMQLERLAFISKRSHVGAVKGERKSPRRGSSVEFADAWMIPNTTPGSSRGASSCCENM